MRSKLPSAFHSALEIRAPLKGVALHGAVLELVEWYHVQYEMLFPSLNTPLLLYKHMTNLGLPGTFSKSEYTNLSDYNS